jgi:hypothetical protein
VAGTGALTFKPQAVIKITISTAFLTARRASNKLGGEKHVETHPIANAIADRHALSGASGYR